MTDKTLHKFDKKMFNHNLISWYHKNKRELPWRDTNNPYAIWVSEIMLQQTKVDTVISYYKKFMNRYPTIFHLAKAEQQEVLKEWEGLGYYSRARNLHDAAREVVATYHGEVPKDPKQLGTLKGIGPYTQGAISSIAFQQPEPAVDGNVMRVLSRVLLVKDNISEQRTRKKFEHIVRELICHSDPSAFNQGLMELGALICTPTSPACLLCPVQNECRAFAEGCEKKLPVKLKKKKQKTVSYLVLLIRDVDGKIAIEKRPDKGLLANMWQFPMIELKDKHSLEKIAEKKYGIPLILKEELGHVNHVFSHLIWDLHVYEAICATRPEISEQVRLSFIKEEELQDYPFSVSHIKVREFLQGKHG